MPSHQFAQFNPMEIIERTLESVKQCTSHSRDDSDHMRNELSFVIDDIISPSGRPTHTQPRLLTRAPASTERPITLMNISTTRSPIRPKSRSSTHLGAFPSSLSSTAHSTTHLSSSSRTRATRHVPSPTRWPLRSDLPARTKTPTVDSRAPRPSSLPAECEECGKILSCRGNLNRHKKTSHMGRRFRCTVPGCGLSFGQAHDMRRHMRRKHK